jgi:DNA-binding NarL/FixJ family response regulator
MTIAVAGPAGAGASVAAPVVERTQPKAAAPAPPTATEDKVTISAAAQEIPQPMSIQVRSLHNEGQSVPQIATKLAISPSAVQSYLGTPAVATK